MLNNRKAIETAKNLILIVNGGIGRNIMSTVVVRNLKKQFPKKKLLVVCGTPEIFMRNKNVDRLFHLGNALYLYEDYVKDTRSVFLDVEPYRHFGYIYKQEHFVKCWCDLLGIECDSIYPELFFSDTEKKLAEECIKQYDKDMVLCQFEGGKIPQDRTTKEKEIAKGAMYKRSIPEEIQVEIVDKLNALNYKVGIVAHENQFKPGCAEWIHYPVRAICALLPHIKEVIAIDSFLIHACAAFKKKALVMWAGTSPDILGYKDQINLRKKECDDPECHRPNSYLFDIQPTGYQWECPIDDKCTKYNSEAIMNEFELMTGGRHGESRLGKQKSTEAPTIDPYCPCDKGTVDEIKKGISGDKRGIVSQITADSRTD